MLRGIWYTHVHYYTSPPHGLGIRVRADIHHSETGDVCDQDKTQGQMLLLLFYISLTTKRRFVQSSYRFSFRAVVAAWIAVSTSLEAAIFGWVIPRPEKRMGESQARELALLDQAGQALAEAQSFDQIKVIRDKAEAVRKYAQSASLGLEIQNRAAEVKLRAERQAGKLLAQMTLRGGDRRSKHHRERLKLDDLGISRNQSTRWQMEAQVPENAFREHIRETCDTGKELTSARLMRFARHWVESAVVDGSVNGRNGNGETRNGKIHNTRSNIDGAGQSSNGIAEIVSELANHHQLLDNVLQPVYSSANTTLAAAERRVLRYLMLETQQLLARLDKLQRTVGSRCTCRDDWAAS
jgi:hypothetical protein